MPLIIGEMAAILELNDSNFYSALEKAGDALSKALDGVTNASMKMVSEFEQNMIALGESLAKQGSERVKDLSDDVSRLAKETDGLNKVDVDIAPSKNEPITDSRAKPNDNRLGNALNKTGAVLFKAGLAAATALGGVAIASTKMAMDFEKNMANVGTLLGKDGSDRVNELGSDVKRLAQETGKPLEDLAGGLYQIVSAFGDTSDSAKLLEVAAKASSAGLSTTLEAVDLLSAVTKGYGDTSVAAVQKVSDLAFQTVKLGERFCPATRKLAA